jgi:glycosyltransferase involved in cell wall biosynthesis
MENHAFQLSQVLLSRGHEVGILHLIFDPQLEEYKLLSSEWEGLDIFKLVRNYTNPMLNPYPFYDRKVEGIFEQLLAIHRPDLVHIHHMADLSASLPETARRHGIPAIHTLHDFWPMCFVAHLRTPDGILCPGPDEGLRCVECKWKQWRQSFSPISIRARTRELGFWESLRRAPRFAVDLVSSRLTGGHAAAQNAILRTQMMSLPPRNDYLRKALLACTLLISPSRFLISKFVEWGIPESHFRHLYNSVPASLRQVRSMAREPRDHIVFGFIGTLYPPKGVPILVEAFERLGSDHAALHIWGDVPITASKEYADGLKEQGKRLPNLVFHGSFPPEKLAEVLLQTDVLVLPSTWYENNPLVILEALAAGVPVLAGDIGGMAELVQHDVNGLQFRVGDPQDLAEKMRMMLDPERLARYRASITAPWSHEEMGTEVEQIYRELLATR